MLYHYWVSITAISIVSTTVATAATISTKKFQRLNLADIYNEMDNVASKYPDFVTITSTQDEFDLPSSCKDEHDTGDSNTFGTEFGSSDSGPGPPAAGCTNRYIVLEDPVIYSHPHNGRKALRQRPDVFLSGAIHGNERVGPVAMIEVAKLLALAATCEADRDSLSLVSSSLEDECNIFYAKYSKKQSSWLAQLVSTRRIVIFPAPNSSGYHLKIREEPYYGSGTTSNIQYIDPNRDFAFDNTSSKNCMKTITARGINELFRKYLFQMSMTYHGGVENITFEWGALSVPSGKLSPDDVAQRILAEKMSLYAGELDSNVNSHYETGDMNSVVYGIYGGFEDWAYAGSWANDLMKVCTPTTYGGYDSSKTIYDDATLATFNMLVEISNNKNPPSDQYGSDEGMLNPPFLYDNNVNNGYATKHIRTALMAIDTVEPYVQIHRVRKKTFYNDYQPLRQLKSRWCKMGNVRKVGVKNKTKTARIFWNVGGSFSVDETFLLYGLWSNFPYSMNCIHQMDHDVLMPILEGATILGAGSGMGNNTSILYKTPIQKNGTTQWSDPHLNLQPSFSTKQVDFSNFQKGDAVAIFAVAKVDQKWTDAQMAGGSGGANNIWPEDLEGQPQSHMVNGRTNAEYYREKPGSRREVQGRLYWISVPITFKIR